MNMKWTTCLGIIVVGLGAPTEEAQAKSCNNDSNSVPTIACYQLTTWTLWTQTVEIESGASYEILTTDLSLLPNESNTPDTVLWLVDPATNDVMASNDDTVGLASKITFTATSSFTGLIVVTR